jgi:hypothetical protein
VAVVVGITGGVVLMVIIGVVIAKVVKSAKAVAEIMPEPSFETINNDKPEGLKVTEFEELQHN